MSKGHAKHQERHHGLSQFGKDLIRRCGSKCELCEAHGVKLTVYEVPPIASDPNYDQCLMLCEICAGQLDKPRIIEPSYWHFLASTMWSDLPPVKILSIALLQHLSVKEDWAAGLLEQVYIDQEEQVWLDQVDLF